MTVMTPQAASLLIEAGRMFTAGGATALADGQADRAVGMLTRAREILACADDPIAGAPALELLLTALVEAGQADSAHQLTASVDELECAGLEPGCLVRLRLQLARADAVAEEPVRGISRVQDARALLQMPGTQSVYAALDVTEARLITQTDLEGGDQIAQKLAREALAVIGDQDHPQVACLAWEVLGVVGRQHDLTDSTACFRQARLLAQRHKLPFCRLRAQLELGVNEWLAGGSTERLQVVRQAAARNGALAVSSTADATIAMDLVFRGRYAEASQMIDKCWERAQPAGLRGTLRWLALIRSVLAAHQCRRQEMEMALDELAQLGGKSSPLMPLAPSHSRTVCALLEENWEQAHRDSGRAAGLQRLLNRMPTSAHQGRDPDLSPTPVREPRNTPFWDLPFALLESAVLLARRDRESEALALFAQAEHAAARYDLAWHLGLRLVAEIACQDGWGFPELWLRRAYQYFHERPGSAVPNACRSLLRRNGTPMSRSRRDADLVPPELVMLGVTARELEVLQVLATRAGNKDIAAKLCISPRTVEKHIASLLAKTAQPNRRLLIGFALGLFGGGSAIPAVSDSSASSQPMMISVAAGGGGIAGPRANSRRHIT